MKHCQTLVCSQADLTLLGTRLWLELGRMWGMERETDSYTDRCQTTQHITLRKNRKAANSIQNILKMAASVLELSETTIYNHF